MKRPELNITLKIKIFNLTFIIIIKLNQTFSQFELYSHFGNEKAKWCKAGVWE